MKFDSAILPVALWLIIIGGVVTSLRRLRRIATFLRARV
jgi:hypothetical protein